MWYWVENITIQRYYNEREREGGGVGRREAFSADVFRIEEVCPHLSNEDTGIPAVEIVLLHCIVFSTIR